jgi:hypothetical protein
MENASLLVEPLGVRGSCLSWIASSMSGASMVATNVWRSVTHHLGAESHPNRNARFEFVHVHVQSPARCGIARDPSSALDPFKRYGFLTKPLGLEQDMRRKYRKH